MEKKYLYLKDYAKELKANLKIHKGETIIKGSEIESQFKTYSKLQRLFKHVDKRDVKEYEKHIDSFYKKIEDKRKLEVKDHIEKVIVEEKKVDEVILSRRRGRRSRHNGSWTDTTIKWTSAFSI